MEAPVAVSAEPGPGQVLAPPIILERREEEREAARNSVSHQEMDEEALAMLRPERYDNLGRALFLSDTVTSWPLRVLGLNLEREPINCSILWPALSRFHGTLENLQVHSVGGIMQDDDEVQLQLPKLKKINFLMTIKEGTIGFDALLYLNHLQEISVSRYDEKSRPEDAHAMVKVFGMMDNIQESNIWGFFPFLRKLEINKKTFNFERN